MLTTFYFYYLSYLFSFHSAGQTIFSVFLSSVIYLLLVTPEVRYIPSVHSVW